MITEQNRNVAENAKHIYVERLQSKLEASHLNQFVAIEPASGDHFTRNHSVWPLQMPERRILIESLS